MIARRAKGFTLLEMLAALSLLMLLMAGVWAGIATIRHTVTRGRAQIAGLSARRGAEQFLRRNLAQIRPMPWARKSNGAAVVFLGNSHVMRFVAPLPGFLGRKGAQLQTLKLVSDDHGTFRLEAAFALLPPDGSKPRPLGKPEVLLAGVHAGHFDYRGFDRKGHDTGWRDHWTRSSRLPELVKVVLQPARGSWPVLEVPLRVDSSAISRAVIRSTELQELQP